MNYNYVPRAESRSGPTFQNQSKSIALKSNKAFSSTMSSKNEKGGNIIGLTKQSDLDRINELRNIYNVNAFNNLNYHSKNNNFDRGSSLPHNDLGARFKNTMNRSFNQMERMNNPKLKEMLTKTKGEINIRNTMTAAAGKLNYSPLKKLNKPKSSYLGSKVSLNNNNMNFNTPQKTNLDSLLMSYKNAPLNNPININFNSFDTRVNYSNQVHQINNKSGRRLSSYILKTEENNIESIYNPSAKSVREFAYKEEKNMEFRKSMEDFCKIIDRFMNDNSKGVFCLYDGHGGTELVKYVRDRMPDLLSRFLLERNSTVEKSFTLAFQKIDDELKLMSDSQNTGTTACVVYFNRENDPVIGSKRVLYCANVGDTRAILISSTNAKRLSYDHKCIDEEEVTRIRKIGGIVFNGRVFGQLAISRALGDHAMKKYGVVPTPYVNKHVISERDKYVVMCSDGVWDALDESQVFDISLTCTNAEELAEAVVKKAVNCGSRDNISCIVIKLN